MKYFSFQHIVLYLLFVVAAFLRTYQIEEYPLTINQDELNNIYDGWSFAETGKDRWETANPFVLKGLGNNDYRQSTEAWLCAVVFRIFGYSVPAGRYLSSFLGLLTLWLLYSFCRKIADERFALYALAFAVFSPYHIQMSRMAHEGAVLPSLCLLGILHAWLLLMENEKKTKFVLWLGFLIGLSANTYRSMYVIGPVLLLLVIIPLARKKDLSAIRFLILSAAIGALPQLYSVLSLPAQVLERADNVVLKPGADNGYIWTLLKNMAENLSPRFLFFNFGRYNNLTVMRELPFECLFFYPGLVLLLVKNRFRFFQGPKLVLLLLVCILPAAISLHNPHALRASALMVVIPMVSAAGFTFIAGLKSPGSNIWMVLLLVLNLSFLAWYLRQYTSNDILRNDSHQHELVRMSKWVSAHHQAYDSVYLDNSGNSPYLYVMAFVPVTPREFQEAEKLYRSGVWIEFDRLNKFRFMEGKELKQKFNSDTSARHLYISYEPMRNLAFDSIGNIYNKTYFTVPTR